jgi:thioredoxin-related protein
MKTIFLILLITISTWAKEPVEKEKLVMVFTHMNHCGWCEKMQKETIDNKEALKEIKKNYIFTKIKKESADMPSFLHPQLFPTVYILTSDGSKVIEKIEGYMKRDKFLKYTKTLYEIEMDDTPLE